jgi:hypothetical protein
MPQQPDILLEHGLAYEESCRDRCDISGINPTLAWSEPSSCNDTLLPELGMNRPRRPTRAVGFAVSLLVRPLSFYANGADERAFS